MKNIDIVAGGGEVRAYLKSVGLNHLAKAKDVEATLALLSRCSADVAEMIDTAVNKVFGTDVTTSVEVGENIVIKVASEAKQSTIDLADLIKGGYISDLFIDLIKDIDQKLR